jgi:hypothetical protein
MRCYITAPRCQALAESNGLASFTVSIRKQAAAWSQQKMTWRIGNYQNSSLRAQ